MVYKRAFLLIVPLFFCIAQKATTASFQLGEVIFSDDFDIDRSNWTAEIRMPGSVSIKNGVLEIDVAKGCTVWLKKKLTGPVLIEFEVQGVDGNGPNDSVNDMNIFWMAKDPAAPGNIFQPDHSRRGDFSDYHHLRLYYVGHGKDYSTGVGRVRFRRYTGGGARPLLPEHTLDDDEYLVPGNSVRTVQVVACDDLVQYISDGELIYDFRDPAPYTDGWFAFRTVHSHLIIDNFRVYRLISKK